MAVTLDSFMAALSGQESGGSYDATNPDSGAHGRWQIMPSNWPSWAQEAGLPANAPQTPANQERVVRTKLTQYYQKFGNWADVAAAWYSGQPLGPNADAPQGGGKYPSIRSYANNVVSKAGGTPMNGRAPAPDVQFPGGRAMPPADQASTAGATWRNPLGGTGLGAGEGGNSGTASTGGGGFNWQDASSAIDDVITEWQQHKPRPDDPKYQPYDPKTNPGGGNDFLKDKVTWANGFASLLTQRRQYQLAASGLHENQDGSIIALGDLPPDQRAEVDRVTYNAYAKTMNDLGLGQFTAQNTAITQANSAKNSDFNNQMTQFNSGLSFDTANQARARAKVDTWMKAQDVSSADQKAQQDAQDQAVKWGTSNGKTDFSANDLGGLAQRYAQLLGIPADTPMLRYPGYQTMDPVAQRLASLQAMGVDNAPPSTPDLMTHYQDIPGRPTLDIPSTNLPPQLLPRGPRPQLSVGGSILRIPGGADAVSSAQGGYIP